MAYIKVIDYNESEGELRDIYDHLIKTRGKLADVHQVQSLNPPTISSHMKLYLDIMFSQSPLKRYQREMIAVVVSASNQCEYCIRHHGEALLHYWKSEDKLNALVKGFETANLSAADQALCQLAKEVTLNPAVDTKEKIEKLYQFGFEDRAILDATLVISYLIL